MNLHIRPCRTLRGSATMPGDKSISHRALVLGAVRALGVMVEQPAPAELIIHGVGLRGLRPPAGPIDCQGSGATMRMLAGILAGHSFTCILDGHAGLRRRPMERVAAP